MFGTWILLFVFKLAGMGPMQHPDIQKEHGDITLKTQMRVQPLYLLGEPVTLVFELTNLSGRGIYFLKWYTPLEGVRAPVLVVERNGKPLSYNGLTAKRTKPSRSHFIHLSHLGTISESVDLSAYYDFSKPGEYKVRFVPRPLELGFSSDQVPDNTLSLAAEKLVCEDVSFKVQKPAK